MVYLIPALVINITNKCNLNCKYCTEWGENYFFSKDILFDFDVLVRLFSLLKSNGFETIRLTGGEPLFVWNKTRAVLEILDPFNFNNVRLNTNGVLLIKHCEYLSKLNLRMLKVSLDTLQDRVYRKITGKDKLRYVLQGIDKALDYGIPIEVNMVLTKTTLDSVEGLVQYCIEKKINLKILDLVLYPGLSLNVYNELYVNPKIVVSLLRKKLGNESIRLLSSGRGVPMFEFKGSNSTHILVKDSNLGSTYSDYCNSCSVYPCKEGLFSCVISPDWKYRICKFRNDYINIEPDRLENIIEITKEAYKNWRFVEGISINNY